MDGRLRSAPENVLVKMGEGDDDDDDDDDDEQ